MWLTEQFKKLNGDLISSYLLRNKLETRQLRDFAEKLNEQGFAPSDFRLSNDDDYMDRYFRVFPTLREFNIYYPEENISIDDFGVHIIYEGRRLSLSFVLPNKMTVIQRDKEPFKNRYTPHILCLQFA